MKVIDTGIPEVKIIEPDIYGDKRGWFMESWNQKLFNEHVAQRLFVQDNHSASEKGVLRGLHYQTAPYEQGKLVRVTKGSAFDVAVDIRPESPTYGKYVSAVLSETNKRMLWVPEGFAHGFVALEDDTHFLYKTTNKYNKSSERAIRWDSDLLSIDWPLRDNLIISEKDAIAPAFTYQPKLPNKSVFLSSSLISLIDLPPLGDERGSLVSIEAATNIPFDVKRVYYIYGTKNGVSRGFHAHKNLKQLAVCVSGSCRMLLDDGKAREEIWLNTPEVGLIIGNNIWREMHDFSEDCVLLVLASEHYDESDYIRDYSVFIKQATQ